jgi:hypothetical protein
MTGLPFLRENDTGDKISDPPKGLLIVRDLYLELDRQNLGKGVVKSEVGRFDDGEAGLG